MATHIVSDTLMSLAGITGLIAAFTKLLPLLVQLVRACRDFYIALPHYRTRRRHARTRLRARRTTLRPSFQSALRPARPRPVISGHDRLDPAPHVEIPHDPHPPRLHRRNEIIENMIHHPLVKNSVITKAPEV